MQLPETCVALLLVLSACATTDVTPRKPLAPDRRVSNLRRAATLPWVDDGRCAVREASGEWPVLVDRCFHALDLERIRFRDVTGKCHVAQVGEAVMALEVGACILAAPEIAGAVIIIGSAVVVAYAIHEALEAYERSSAPGRVKTEVRAPSSSGNQPSANRRPVPEPKGGGDVFPPTPPDSPDPPNRDECIPRPVAPRGGDKLHNQCADDVPGNAFREVDVLVNGKAFDALQPLTRTLWEVKTDNFDMYSPALKKIVIEKEVMELRRELRLAQACGFAFRIGVRSAAHKAALERADKALEDLIVVMDWC